MKTPSSRLRAAVTQAIARGPGPVSRWRARSWGFDALRHRPPVVEFYYEAGDPHSHLCAQLLPLLRARLRTELVVRVVGRTPDAFYPEAGSQRHFALQDAARIAPAWGLAFPTDACLPDESRRAEVGAVLAVAEDDLATFMAREVRLAPMLWKTDAPTSGTAVDGRGVARLSRNNTRREKLGHYLPAMWQFDGEWFWGVDRLQHLERRLRAKNLLKGDAPLATFDATQARLPQLSGSSPLEFFFSFRSPYSYLAAVQVQALLPHLGVPLVVRPVLPMVMRGLKVPAAKRFYIVRDVYREARRLGISFGRIADPVGVGAERCLTLFPLAEDADRQMAYLVSAARAIWSEAVDVAGDEGLRYAWTRAGLDWNVAQATLANDPQLDYAETNRKALFDAGLWGVPCFRLGEFATWGRDRLWMVEEILRRAQCFGAESSTVIRN